MAIVTVDQLKEQIAFTDDMGAVDDDLLARKIDAAEDHVNRLLGFVISDTYGGEGQDDIPPSLIEAVCQLAAHWYENREASIAGQTAAPIPFGVMDIANEYREWEF